MSTILMQSIINDTAQTYEDIKPKLYKKASLWGLWSALLYAGYRYSKVPKMINCDECHKALQSSQSRTNIVPTKITKDDRKSVIKIANDKWIQNRGLQNLQSRKKLCLVLDLDHTLIHSKLVRELSSRKVKKCLDNVAHKDDIYRWNSMGLDSVTKLRPFVRKFLEEANKLFEMYIYTMGKRDYALHVANILDPKSIYFGSRIISRENCSMYGQKGLDVVPVDESGILILDDTEKVWSRHLSNLIVMDRYKYLRSLSEESESAGALSCVLKLLQEVHNLYFGPYNMLDVRVILGNILGRKIVCNSCSMVSAKPFRLDYYCSSHDVTEK